MSDKTTVLLVGGAGKPLGRWKTCAKTHGDGRARIHKGIRSNI